MSKTTAYDPDTKTLFRFVDGILHGKALVFDEDNNIITEFYYENGKKQGPYREYKDNKLVTECTYMNDKKNGNEYIYTTETKISIPYVDGIKNGTQKTYKNDVLIHELPWENNILNGSEIHYLEHKNSKGEYDKQIIEWINGHKRIIVLRKFEEKEYDELDCGSGIQTLEIEMPYVNGKKDGLCKLYCNRNQIFQQCGTITYVDDNKHGLESWSIGDHYNRVRVEWVHGKKHGIEERGTTGRVYEYKCEWVDGLKHGKESYSNSSPSWAPVSYPVSTTCYYENGKLHGKWEQVVTNMGDTHTIYYQNDMKHGKETKTQRIYNGGNQELIYECTWENDVKQGMEKIRYSTFNNNWGAYKTNYYVNGQLHGTITDTGPDYSCEYVNGTKHGVEKTGNNIATWHGGKLHGKFCNDKIQCTYHYDKKDGEEMQISLIGEKTISNYKHDVLHGKQIEYDINMRKKYGREYYGGTKINEIKYYIMNNQPRSQEQQIEYSNTYDTNGKLISVIMYHPNGIMREKSQYRNGVKHGKSTLWRNDGTKVYTKEFENGNEV